MQQQIKAHCSKCFGERNHTILYTESKTEDDCYEGQHGERYDVSWTEYFTLIKCMGCNHISLMHTSTFSENDDREINYYPPAISRPLPKWISELNNILVNSEEELLIGELLKEIYTALYNDSVRLATMGIRSLLEHIMIAKVGDNKSFAKNLGIFMERGYISKVQRELVDRVLEIGHATTHRSYKPNTDEMHTAIDICENVIEMIYIYPKKPTPVLPKRNAG